MGKGASSNSRQIAKNTIALYFRTFITMIVGLYTGRVMLQALGVENYGVNAVVGGIVSMSALITTTMSQGIGRYVTFTLGKGDKERLHTMFSTAINAQIVLSVLIAIVLEIAGVWFLNTQANIPAGRMVAANWVLQCSIVSLAISLISSPFNALIIAHERMAIYAYMSIVDVSLKLVVCFVIMSYGGDRLILLALLNVAVALGMRMFYGWYCGKHFEEAHYSVRVFDKSLMKELTVFSGWNLLTNGAYVFSTHGVNMLVNIFFGVIYNASRSVALTVTGVAQSFVGNFTMAFAPQITKNYADNNVDYAIHLANTGTKFSWLMMYVLIVPMCMEADMLLKLWLGNVPEMAAVFLRLSVFESLAVTSGLNLVRLILATGNVKGYNIRATVVSGLVFPMVWVAYVCGAPVWCAYVIFIVIYSLLNIVRFYVLKRLMGFSVKQHLHECVYPCVLVSVVSFVVPMVVAQCMEQSVVRFFVNGTVSVLWTCLCCFMLGLTKGERRMVMEKASVMLKKITK